MSQEKGVKFTNETLIKSCVCDGRNLNPKFGSQYAYKGGVFNPPYFVKQIADNFSIMPWVLALKHSSPP